MPALLNRFLTNPKYRTSPFTSYKLSLPNMPLEVSQDQGESGISVKTTAAEGEKLEVDQAAKVSPSFLVAFHAVHAAHLLLCSHC